MLSVRMTLDARPDPIWKSRADLNAYIEEQIRRGVVAPVPASRRVAVTVLGV